MSNAHRNLSIFGMSARVLSLTVRRWPLISLALFFLFSEGPHLRVAWSCVGSCERQIYIECTYLGSRGLVSKFGPACPLLAWLDTKGRKP